MPVRSISAGLPGFEGVPVNGAGGPGAGAGCCGADVFDGASAPAVAVARDSSKAAGRAPSAVAWTGNNTG